MVESIVNLYAVDEDQLKETLAKYEEKPDSEIKYSLDTVTVIQPLPPSEELVCSICDCVVEDPT